MIKFFILLAVSISTMGLKSPKSNISDEAVAMQVELETIQEIEARYGLQFCGNGGGMMEGIQSMVLSFNCLSAMTREEANTLISKCVYIFLNKINNNLKIRTRLYKYPFELEDVQINITFQHEDGSYFKDLTFTSLRTRNGITRFLDSRSLSTEEAPIVPLSQINFDDANS